MKTVNLSQLYNNSKIIKSIAFSISCLIFLPIIIVLCLIKPFLNIQFIRLRDDRIGHLAMNTELFLRRVQLGIYKKNVFYIGIASKNPCNNQLLNMYKRAMPIIQIPKFVEIPLNILSSREFPIKKFGLYQDLVAYSNEYYEFSHSKPSLKFTSEEEKKGKELLKKMGLTDKDWFVCFHARDPEYLSAKFKSDTSYHNFRNWDINTAVKAAEYIASKGGYAIRMGFIIEKKLKTKNPRIIDYASNYRSDFGDIYLPSKCKFFVGEGCGINQVAQIFNVPVAWVNRAPLEEAPFSGRDLFIPKKHFSLAKKRFLAFHEIIDLGISNSKRAEEYANVKVKLVDNSCEEILDLVIEMNEGLDGKFKYTKEDQGLQKRYKSLFKKGSHCYGFPSRVGARFLRQNKELLKQNG